MPDRQSGAPAPRWQDFDALLVREYGSYLHNVISGLPGLCTVCATPVSDGYQQCLACSRAMPRQAKGPSKLADRTAFLTYAVEGGQAYSVLRGYKTPNVQDRYWTAAATWMVWFLGRHGACAQQVAGTAATEWMWATVPSVRSGRDGEHPLHAIVRQFWGGTHAEAQLALAPAAVNEGRDYNPSRFGATGVVPGSHVILVEDSWATGANVQSAAAALKAAGAAQVSAMVLARLLNDTWEPTRLFIASGGLRSPFDPDACPWTGMGSHH